MRDEDECHDAASAERAQDEGSFSSVELFKPGSRVADSDAAAQEIIGAFLDDAVAVPDFDFQAIVCNAREDFD
jgi:hypothetical protein